jgi:hypothetical protein
MILQKRYTKVLMGLIVGSLLICNGMLSFGLHLGEYRFIMMKAMLMLLGFYSAGEESVLVTLLRENIPDKTSIGTYFGVFDSCMALAKFLGTISINLVWLLFFESIIMAGRFCLIMMIVKITI